MVGMSPTDVNERAGYESALSEVDMMLHGVHICRRRTALGA